jgi:hypothetical protein
MYRAMHGYFNAFHERQVNLETVFIISYYSIRTIRLKSMMHMLTIVETPLFSKLWPAYWSEVEYGDFAAYLARHPEAGDVVQASGGVRKLRWKRAGSGKSGGVRVIYFVRNQEGEAVLLFMYAKAKLDTLKASTLKELRDAIE